MRVVVTGTREGRPDLVPWLVRFTDKHGIPELFVLGCARGVDAQALRLCHERRWSHAVVFADWALGKAAGHQRNQRMVDLATVGDWCLAFPGGASVGTWDCVRRAKAAGLQVAVLTVRR